MALAVIGYFLFAQFANYTYESERHIQDLIRAKLWSLFIIIVFAGILYWKRNSKIMPPLAVLAVSIYFIIIYSILFRGTEYGLNAHWGDNGYRLMLINKMMVYNRFADPFVNNLTCLYPPLYFYTMSLYAKILGLQAYQTLKFGYFFIFMLYPWLLYFSWRLLVNRWMAAAISVITIFFAHRYLNYGAYEHITAALFLPWWLYYFEDAKGCLENPKKLWRFYIGGILIGSAIFMTYYYWFFIAIAAFPISIISRYLTEKSPRILIQDIRHKAVMAVGITISTAIYWFPIIYGSGFTSIQTSYFSFGHSNLAGFINNALDGLVILTGIFFAVYFWNRWKNAHIAIYYAGAIILVFLDRIFNLGNHSVQSRKVLEFMLVMTIPPLVMGVELLWNKIGENRNFRRSLIAVIVVLAIVCGNKHIENIRGGLYKVGINTRYPAANLAGFKNANCYGTVFLTNLYIESCYLPYFSFNPITNVAAHPAGKFEERRNFLRAISNLKQPKLMAYALTYNMYDKIDYVFLPYNGKTKCLELQANTVTFDNPIVVDTIRFPAENFSDTLYFTKIDNNGMMKINPPERSGQLDSILQSDYPDIENQME